MTDFHNLKFSIDKAKELLTQPSKIRVTLKPSDVVQQ